ncbi:unnamed protein product [Mytilus coruscus]|uniref:Uncharacterized protein n=1 Tax=Mytilus coruscus TaxID=42192 RepID=A0A6J8BNU9_MYTCO|nr:unnamed protein product [Mytilus coruscus]
MCSEKLVLNNDLNQINDEIHEGVFYRVSSVTPLKSKYQTDWNKCCLCQTDKKDEDLKSPPTHFSCSKENDGYYMTATNIPLFHAINQLPIISNPSRLDECDGFENTLRRNNAKYYQNCRLLLKNTKLDRARKRSAISVISPDDRQRKIRRTSIECRVCFLCNKENPTSELRQAMTKQLDKRLNECAQNPNDEGLIIVLSGGDVVAQELFVCNFTSWGQDDKFRFNNPSVLQSVFSSVWTSLQNKDFRTVIQNCEALSVIYNGRLG